MNNIVSFLRKQRQENKDHNTRISLATQYLEFFPQCIYIKEELALAIWFNDPLKSLQILNDIENSRQYEEHIMRRICFNKLLLLKHLSATETCKNPEYPILHFVPLITFSITSCQRLDLFIETINSFLNNFKDKHLIFEWICVDDNSDENDRNIMKQKFPFINFIWKTIEQAGHATSMQIISEKVKTPYLIHIEDDRILIDPKFYIADMISILEHDENLGQVVFNHNYTETLDDDIIGGLLKRTNDGVFYFQHEYITLENERQNFYLRHGSGKTVNYYPHFSLAPSMINTKIFQKCKFKNVLKFEYVFALDYTNAGYKTAFLPGFHFKHVGRLTSELNDPSKFNAYDLNNIEQFTFQTRYKFCLINLDRRVDRLNLVYNQKLPAFERISAIDGNELNMYKNTVLKINQLCGHGDYNLRSGVVGCALSHLKLYKRLLSDNDNDGYIIMEDDIAIQPSQENVPLKIKVDRIFRVLELKGEPINLVFFTIVPKYYDMKHSSSIKLEKKSYEEACEFSIGGTGCYYISKNMAKLVFDYINNNGIDCPIDVILYRLLNHINGYFVLPPLFSQIGSTPSDILNTHSIDKIERIDTPPIGSFEIIINKLFTLLK